MASIGFRGAMCFRIARRSSERALVRQLRETSELIALPRESRELTYYDTFDWRLHARGLRLTSQVDAAGARLSLRPVDPQSHGRSSKQGGTETTGGDLSGGRLGEPCGPIQTVWLEALPRFAADLPEGPLRRELESAVGVRRLLPLVRAQVTRRMYRVLDDERKTVVKLCFEQAKVGDPGAPECKTPLAGTIEVVPVMGFRRAFDDLVERLTKRRYIEAEPLDLGARALEAIGRRPVRRGDMTSSMLDIEAPAGQAFVALERALFETLRENEHGIREDLDIEHLHDFRVAVRRGRVLHRIFRVEISGTEFEALEPGYKWLGRVTSPTRDLDVHLQRLHEDQVALGSDGDALRPLERLLQERRLEEWKRLIAALDSEPWRELEARSAALLDGPPSPAAQQMATRGPPLGPWASSRIDRAWRRMSKHGRRIGPTTPDAQVHQVRLDAKKLRYLLEFFRGLYPGERIDPLVKELKRFQDNLGGFNDAVVQAATLRELAWELSRRGTGGETLLVLGRLVERAEQRRKREQEDFHRRFQRFDSCRNRKRFRTLFAVSKSGQAATWQVAETELCGAARRHQP